MFKKILVPLDGSALSETVLPHVAELAKKSGAQIVLMRMVSVPVESHTFAVLPTMPVPVMDMPQGRDYFAEAEGYLRRVAYDFFPDQHVTLHVSGGSGAQGILDFLADPDVDLIAMTTHGRSGLSRMVLGSVADDVVRHSHLPVLLVRPPERPIG